VKVPVPHVLAINPFVQEGLAHKPFDRQFCAPEPPLQLHTATEVPVGLQVPAYWPLRHWPPPVLPIPVPAPQLFVPPVLQEPLAEL
jgi:hypothetical protein